MLPVNLSDSDQKTLVKISKSKKDEHRRVQRSKILLMAASGDGNKKIAEAVGLSTVSVRNTISKFHNTGINGALSDDFRSGRPRLIDDDAKAWVVSQVCQQPKMYLLPDGQNRPEELWTLRSFTGHVQNNCAEVGHDCLSKVSPSTIHGILNEHHLKPHRVRYFLSPTDPDFAEKMKDVCQVYKEAKIEREKMESDDSETVRAELEIKKQEGLERERIERELVESDRLKRELLDKQDKEFEIEDKQQIDEDRKELNRIQQEQPNLKDKENEYKEFVLKERTRLESELKEVAVKKPELNEEELKQECAPIEIELSKLKSTEQDNKNYVSKERKRINNEHNNLKSKRQIRLEKNRRKREKEKKRKQEQAAEESYRYTQERRTRFNKKREDNNKKDVVFISYDEKPGIQALALALADLVVGMVFYGCIGRCYEYKRLGTVDLLAGLNLVTGEITTLIRNSHKSSDFIDFLRILDERYADADLIKIIMDNHSIHLSEETRDFLKMRPDRFEFIFTPTHGSWLNLVESFFGKLTKGCLRHIRVTSKEELIQRINTYVNEINKNPVIYNWKYKMDEEKDFSQAA
jgi:transposase